MSKIMKTMDGNEAAAYASYAFTEVAAIYPITPSSPMAEHVDAWAAHGKKNIFGTPVKLVEMQSEAGAISAVHGALDAGVLASSYTASQGLMLMIPTMFRIAGQLKPGVVHVASRNVATSAISIFAEHSDVMACRPTGFAMMASSTVQEAMDLGAVSHLAAIKGHVPFLHYFDGFRTSHEIQKVECLDYEELAKLVDQKELKKFRDNALNPESPVLRTTGQNPDTYFQQREAANPYYEALPDVVESCMDQINEITGRNYKLFNYYGSPEAETVLVGMGSVTGTIQETIDYLVAQGKKVGYLEVHLFRPFSPKHFFHELPDTVKKITVLDRDKEAGAVGEPLFEEMVDFETFAKSDYRAVKIKDCAPVPKSKKLLQFTLDDGSGTDRTILSGIHEYYEPEDLIGKTAIAIVNLPPRKMMGIDSCGMLISAVHEEDGHEGLHLLIVDDHIPAGAKLY